ncbi:MAG: sulfatase [Pirellulaceae bacterium]|nr:sulfatase [Pirellulaceae bacterium]
MKNLILILLLAVIESSLPGTLLAERPGKPNVVMILSDDLGWQDVGCYDIDEPCPFETPHIDRLASEGVKFWQAYSPAPTCAPSRAAILSGKHPARAQKTHVVGGAPPSPYKQNSPLISPWYSGRMPISEFTIAEALKTNGYTTGHVGKWHVAINHNAFPQPTDQGFDFTRADRGATSRPRPDRLSAFATDAEDDPYRLDRGGFPYHQNSQDALTFLNQSKAEPFFLYFATWLVHAPIHTRSEMLLRKYCKKMNVPFPTDPTRWEVEGQNNPYYGAMVEMLDHYVGSVVDYLNDTEDPRWPGHKLAENTYVIFTSDNGGMEGHPGEIITDNFPLDKGKINAKEGGVRVPLIIRGPGIASGAESNAMVNGLDFYPTILDWTGTSKPTEQHLDGSDLAPFLASKTLDPAMIVDVHGNPRDTMFWHFPHSSMQSTIRKGSQKLIRNWKEYLLSNRPALELYQLYDQRGQRVDIEEANNLSANNPARAEELNRLLEKHLSETQASPPYLNPNCNAEMFGKEKVCQPLEHGRDGKRVWMKFRENGAKVVKANLIYTLNGGDRYEEWYRADAKIFGDKVEARLPPKTSHYVFNLIDENHYLVSYPSVKLESDSSENYSARAISAK